MTINFTNIEESASYQEWQSHLPLRVTQSELWAIPEYRLARYASTLGTEDREILFHNLCTKHLASQLSYEIDKIAERIATAHASKNPEFRLRTYREAIEATKKSWRLYYSTVQAMGNDTVIERFHLLKRIRLMLIDSLQIDLVRLNLVARISTPEVHQNAMQMYRGMQQVMA